MAVLELGGRAGVSEVLPRPWRVRFRNNSGNNGIPNPSRPTRTSQNPVLRQTQVYKTLCYTPALPDKSLFPITAFYDCVLIPQ